MVVLVLLYIWRVDFSNFIYLDSLPTRKVNKQTLFAAGHWLGSCGSDLSLTGSGFRSQPYRIRIQISAWPDSHLSLTGSGFRLDLTEERRKPGFLNKPETDPPTVKSKKDLVAFEPVFVFSFHLFFHQDGSSEHFAHVWNKIGLQNKNRIWQIEIPDLLLCAHSKMSNHQI